MGRARDGDQQVKRVPVHQALQRIRIRAEVASGRGEHFPNVGKISVSNALRLLAVPEEEREDFAREVDAEHISARDLEKAIRERDEARKHLETADRELGEAQKALRDTEAELAETKDALEDQRVKREDAEDAAQKMEAMLREAESRPVEVAIDETAVQRAVEEAKAAAAEEKKKAVAELERS